MKYIGYHTRLFSDNTHKVSGGIFPGPINATTVDNLVTSHFTVSVYDGRCVLVDRDSREVTLYLSVDAAETTKGVEALRVWRLESERLEAEAKRRREMEEGELGHLMQNLTHEEIVKRLKGN